MKKILMGLVLILIMSGKIYATELTAEYLEGKWCLIQEETLDELDKGYIDKRNDIWVFSKDGKVLQQTNSDITKLKHKSDWKIDNNKLKMKPSHVKRFWNYKSIDVSENEFIFELPSATKYYIKRGVCTK